MKTQVRAPLHCLVLLTCLLGTDLAWSLEVPELDCVIEPHMIIDLSSRTDGIVESIEVDRGDLVEEGQVLVRLESGVEQAAVEYARAAALADSGLEARKISMDFAQRRRNRLESLYREQALSSDQMDEMETEAMLTRLERDQAAERQRLARLELQQALEVLKRHTIPSPITGVVVQRFLAPGESVEEKPILRLAQIDPLRVEVIVPVAYFGAIEAGQSAVVMPERPMQGEYPAEVTVLDRVADAASGTFRVRLSLPNPDYRLPSGLKCMVKFLPIEKSLPKMKADAGSAPDNAPATDTLRTGKEPRAALATQPASAQKAQATAPAGTGGRITIAHAGLASAAPQAETRRTAPQPVSTTGVIHRQATPARETSQEAAPPSAAPLACRTIGPFDENQLTAAKTALQGHVGQLLVRQQVETKKTGFVIVSEDQGSVPKAKELAEKMRAAGVKDLFVFGRGPHRGRVSLGLYRGPEMAAERVREVQAFGFEAQAMPREANTTRYFVDVELAARARSAELPADARALLTEDKAVPTDCKTIIAARQ